MFVLLEIFVFLCAYSSRFIYVHIFSPLQFDRVKNDYIDAIERVQKQIDDLNPNLKATEKFHEAECMFLLICASAVSVRLFVCICAYVCMCVCACSCPSHPHTSSFHLNIHLSLLLGRSFAVVNHQPNFKIKKNRFTMPSARTRYCRVT